MYTTNFLVVTAKRLKTIDVLANGNRVRAYALSYTTSESTARSLLSSVQQYGKDATLDGEGTVTGGTVTGGTVTGGSGETADAVIGVRSHATPPTITTAAATPIQMPA